MKLFSIGQTGEKSVYFDLKNSMLPIAVLHDIFTNKTLDAIVTKQPKSMKELLNIGGIGSKKAEEFGEEFLSAIQKWNQG